MRLSSRRRSGQYLSRPLCNRLDPSDPVGTSANMNPRDTSLEKTSTFVFRTRPSGTLSTRYVWEKVTGNQDDPPATSPQNSYSDAGEKSRLAFGFRNRFLLTSTFTLPLAIQFASQVDLKGGLPYDVITGTDANGDEDLDDRPSVAGQALRTRSAPATGCWRLTQSTELQC